MDRKRHVGSLGRKNRMVIIAKPLALNEKSYFKETILSIVVYDSCLIRIVGLWTMTVRRNVIKHGDFKN